jgi:deazaflavin-dependent oxidoreductase (nitroreductase family)
LRKIQAVRALQQYGVNPPTRLLFALGLAPPGFALLETIGRVSGKPRRNPVGDGLEGDTFWIVTEHGRHAAYVRNLDANPRARVKVRRGLRLLWRTGTAHLLDEDDPRARQRVLSRRHPVRALNAWTVRTVGTNLLTVRIDLDPLERSG